MSVYVAGAARIRQALLDLERSVLRAQELLDKAVRSGDDGYLDGVALNLHGFYAGIERIFEDIARTTGEEIPGGAEWHRSLLLQMSATIEGVRPPVISRETRYCLDDYRGFRHVVRNVYAFNLKPSRLQELTDALRPCYSAVVADLGDFVALLERLGRTEDDAGDTTPPATRPL